MKNDTDAVYGLQEIANNIHRSVATTRRLLKANRLPASRVGSMWISGRALLTLWRNAEALGEKPDYSQHMATLVQQVESRSNERELQLNP